MSKNSYEKPDCYAIKAQKEGYPARSVYKLEELDQKFKLLKTGSRVLDIGAAPGSWSLWTLKRLGGRGYVAAIDLSPLNFKSPFDNFFFLQGNIYDQAAIDALKAYGPFDLVMSDAAPATTGNRAVDTGQSEALVEQVIELALECLKPGGNVVAKLFQGGAQAELLGRLREGFSSARCLKPKACRPESFETYLVGLGKK